MAAASRRTSRARPTSAYPPSDHAAAYSGAYNDDAEDTQFEFDEADVWSNDVVARVPSFETIHDNGSTMPSSRTSRRPPRRADISSDLKPAAAASSLPVNILDWPKSNPKRDSTAEGGGRVESDEEEDRESRVPPHEYLARRRGASLSVHEGIGRTLKGRDLSRMRDAIWKSVGFAD
ncbi:uncharacterized protein LOC115749793 [Rhodamnia argentea]|uniref:Uncharacterized protein LOC115749793 n=1 Tax=Rhodamnia argentea TaxID=178133 RepID=A0ABM3HQQ5_9MYRT|nr:uncharacterized protein LOC115749793 [Rhodamnia argentea]